MTSNTTGLNRLAQEIAGIGRRFFARGWVPGSAGNFSAVLSREPFRLVITPSSVHKGEMRAEQLLVVDHEGLPESAGSPRPSAECLLHVELAKSRGANAVLHTHSVWNTLLSEHFAQRGAVDLEGFEILKGLAGNSTHAMTEYVPIIDNDQDMVRLAARMRRALAESAGAHAVLLRRHGLYTWGSTLAEAERHVEVLEFLFEVVGRSLSLPATEAAYGTVENS